MSELGFLEKLLNGAEVEWKSVADNFHVRNGYTPSKSNKVFWENGTVPWFRMDDIRENGRVLNQSVQNITEEAVKGNLFPANSMIFSTSATIGEHALVTVPHLANQRFTNLALKNEYTARFDRKFLFYYGFLLAEWCKNNTTKSSFASVDMKGFRKFPVPIPCPEEPERSLAIQGEIVRILDSFTELTAELTAELELRKKQYNHYRDQLLTFEEDEVEWKALGDLTRIKTGQSVNKRMIADNPGKYPVINSGRDPLGFLDDWNTEKDPIGITSRGAGVGSVTWQEGRYYRGNLNYSVTINSEEELGVHYLYHVLEQFQPQIKALCTFDGIPALNAVNLKKLSIPIPPIKEQERIVAILDKFDTLTTSLSEGLPREIELRQKQYEYYRDLLLRFPEPAETAKAVA